MMTFYDKTTFPANTLTLYVSKYRSDLVTTSDIEAQPASLAPRLAFRPCARRAAGCDPTYL